MGEYRNGKWEPTWGDDQFGVVDTLPQMYNNRVRDLNSELYKAEARIEELEIELSRCVRAFESISRTSTDMLDPVRRRGPG